METTEKRPIAEMVEGESGSPIATAFWLYGIQADACNFVDQYRNQNEPGHPIDWELVDHDGLPRDFMAALDKVARYEVRL